MAKLSTQPAEHRVPEAGSVHARTKLGKQDTAKPSAPTKAKLPAPASLPVPPAPQLKKRKPVDELDDIFSKKAAPKAASTDLPPSAPPLKTCRPPAASLGKLSGSKDDIFGSAPTTGRTRTPEGYAVYSEKELGLDRQSGGDTDQCPFDCDCCF